MYKRLQTRLAVDVYASKRLISTQEQITKWSNVIPAKIEEENAQKIIWHLNNADGISHQVTFHLMKCGAKTEYCTEIHLIVEMTNDQEAPTEQVLTQAEQILEELRSKTNKDWIIHDTELNSGLFRSN